MILLAAILLCAAQSRAADDAINVILPLTGSAAFVGNGHNLALAFTDDQSSPHVDVQLTSDALPSKPPVPASDIERSCEAL